MPTWCRRTYIRFDVAVDETVTVAGFNGQQHLAENTEEWKKLVNGCSDRTS
jgi:hypothetical protein